MFSYGDSLPRNEQKIWFTTMDPREQLKILKKYFPESVSPVHLDFLELYFTLGGDRDQFYVAQDGTLDFLRETVELVWDKNIRAFRNEVSGDIVKIPDLKTYLTRKLGGLRGSKELLSVIKGLDLGSRKFSKVSKERRKEIRRAIEEDANREIEKEQEKLKKSSKIGKIALDSLVVPSTALLGYAKTKGKSKKTRALGTAIGGVLGLGASRLASSQAYKEASRNTQEKIEKIKKDIPSRVKDVIDKEEYWSRRR